MTVHQNIINPTENQMNVGRSADDGIDIPYYSSLSLYKHTTCVTNSHGHPSPIIRTGPRPHRGIRSP
jgi:hypothetical protein